MKKVMLAVVLGLNAWLMLSSVVSAEEEPWDPIEPVNRGIFWFNDKFDIYLAEPVAKGYDWLLPDRVQIGVSNFFSNLKYPINLVGDLLQLKFKAALDDTGRFFINTTIGVAGFIDVAKDMKLPGHNQDIGIALAHYGIPSGPYLVLPILGPSNLRDGVGRLAQVPLDPSFYVAYTNLSSSTKWQIAIGSKALELINQRSRMLDAVKAAKESSVDYYLFVQSAYYQYRRGQLYEGHPPEEEAWEEPGEEGPAGAEK